MKTDWGSINTLIYIPLCFYLYDLQAIDMALDSIFTFHYVSTYTLSRISSAFFNLIYIPLCFYLYDRVAAVQNMSDLIYIPLCFYLYG